MEEELRFKCPDCKGEARTWAGEDVPECCGKPMEQLPLEKCTSTDTAEHARTGDEDEPCDDNRG